MKLAAAVGSAAQLLDGGRRIGSKNCRPGFSARVLGVLGFISFGFVLFTLATSNPFLRLIPAAPTAAT